MAIKGDYDIAVISGTTRQARLYKHLGYKPFGPLVGKQDALYQPMYIDIAGAMELKKQSQILKPGKGSKMDQMFYNYSSGSYSNQSIYNTIHSDGYNGHEGSAAPHP